MCLPSIDLAPFHKGLKVGTTDGPELLDFRGPILKSSSPFMFISSEGKSVKITQVF